MLPQAGMEEHRDMAIPLFRPVRLDDWPLLRSQSLQLVYMTAPASISPTDRRGIRRFFRRCTHALLAAALRITPHHLELCTNRWGKPGLTERSQQASALLSPQEVVDFNLSHCAHTALFAMARGSQVGVDIECPRRRTQRRDTAMAGFAALLPDVTTRDGVRDWCRLEALAKMLGVGFSQGLVSLMAQIPPPVRLPQAGPFHCQRRDETTALFGLALPCPYSGALAIRPHGAVASLVALHLSDSVNLTHEEQMYDRPDSYHLHRH
jgi:phosphopantetheinyl transferase